MSSQNRTANRRATHIAKMETQIKTWTNKLDHIVGGFLEAGAQAHDPYRIRVEGMRSRLATLAGKLNDFAQPANSSQPWGPFQASIDADWNALATGFLDLSIDVPSEDEPVTAELVDELETEDDEDAHPAATLPLEEPTHAAESGGPIARLLAARAAAPAAAMAATEVGATEIVTLPATNPPEA